MSHITHEIYGIDNPEAEGKVVAFWSTVHRQGAVSATTAMMAAFIAETLESDEDAGDDKVLVMSNELYGAQTAAHYLTDENMTDGMTEICGKSKSGYLKTYKDIYENTYSLQGKRIDIINSSQRNTNIKDELPGEMRNIFNVARQGYRYTLVDTVSGVLDPTTQAILKHADIVVVCLPQDRFIFESWIKKAKGFYTDILRNKQIIYVCSMYWDYDHMNSVSMNKQLKMGKDNEMLEISLNDIVHKSIGERKVTEMITANMRMVSQSELETGKRKKSLFKQAVRDQIIDELELLFDRIEKSNRVLINTAIQEKEKEEEEKAKETHQQIADLGMFDDAMYSGCNSMADEESLIDLDADNKSAYRKEEDSEEEEVEKRIEEVGIETNGYAREEGSSGNGYAKEAGYDTEEDILNGDTKEER